MGEKVTITRLVELTGMARITVTKRLAHVEPVEKKGNWTYYDCHVAFPALYLAESKMGEKSDGANLTKEKAMLTAAQRKKAEIELALLEGSIIDAEDAADIMANCITESRAKMLGLPRKLGAEFGTDVEERAEALVHEALDELASTDVDRIINGSVEESTEAEGEPVV